MLFDCEDHFTLATTLDAVAVPMFAAERDTPNDPFRMICVNAAHTQKTGLMTSAIRNKRPVDFLSAKDAAGVRQNYASCADLGHATTYGEKLVFNDVISDWNTTLQPVTLGDGRQRIVGTAIWIERLPVRESLDDVAYYSAHAQMQVGKLRHFLEMLEERRDMPADVHNMAMMVGNLTRSIEAVLSDIRALSQPAKPGFKLQVVDGKKAYH